MISVLDFLTLPLAAGAQVERTGAAFRVAAPWAMAPFGSHAFKPGWWAFDCETDADLGQVELRLSGDSGAFVVFPGPQAKTYCVRLSGEETFEVNLVVSPWPSTVSFRTLRLRRLGAAEEGAFLLQSGARVLSRKRSPAQIFRTLQRIASGRPVGIRVSAAEGDARVSSLAAADKPRPKVRPGLRHVEQGGLTAAIREGDTLHPRAFEIAAQAFAADPELQLVHADAIENGVIVPMPGWDPELARHAAHENAAVFSRTGAQSGGAVGRIPLPLVSRPETVLRPLPPLPVPTLSKYPKVSIIIPTKFRVDLLELCFRGLSGRTDYPDFEVILMDNGCEDPRLAEVVAAASFPVTRILDARPFNFSALNNAGARHARGDVLLLLNDDIEPIDPSWLTRLVHSAMRPDVGAVGARLLYPDRTIQHAGVMMGLGGVCGHLWKGRTEAEAALIPHIVYPGSRMAVTAACLAVRRDLYEDAGGLDERYAVALNDIDFCLRLHARGLRNIYRGDSVLVHHESQSRGLDDVTEARRRRLAEETSLFLSRWKHVTRNDPYGSPAFDPSVQSGAVHPSLLTPWGVS